MRAYSPSCPTADAYLALILPGILGKEGSDVTHIGTTGLKFLLRPESFCVHRLPPNWPVDFDKLRSVSWYSVTRTEEELSVVAPQEINLGPGEREPGWSCLRIAGKLDFALRDLPISRGSGSMRLLWLHPHSQRQER